MLQSAWGGSGEAFSFGSKENHDSSIILFYSEAFLSF
jgi:hypothetical protein